ncbi:MAG: glycosyltransferase [Planctomycetota bacterium]|nr:glycosyltransferase [Planctomycetota bacterium]
MFSVVIPTCNRDAILARSLPTVLGMRGAGECEILPVDDGSGDGTPALLAELASRHPNLKPLRQANSGPGEARNRGLAEAKGDHLLFLDDDIFPDPGLLEVHKARLDSGADVSQGRMVWHESLADQPVIRYMDAHGMQFRLDGFKDGDQIPCLHAYTANLALRTADARAAGGFDRAFTRLRYAFEDTAFAWKLEKSGKRIVYTPAAWARHLHPMTEEGLLQREYKVGYGMAVAGKAYPDIAADLGFARATCGLAWKLPVLRVLIGSGLPALLGAEWRRRLAVKQAFLRGIRDGIWENFPGGILDRQ